MADGRTLKVAVTGGSGKVGRAALQALRQGGHRTTNFDIARTAQGGRTVIADFTDFGQTMAALSGVDLVDRGFDAVVHLAGIPAPSLAVDHEIFRVNTLSTYNVFSACQRLGIKRVVWASSETVLGLPFAKPPPFAPLDETISSPEWSYSLTKHLGEEMAKTFVRWDPEMSITSLRFSNVFEPADYDTIAKIQANPEARTLNLWSYVDARDCGEACRLAVENAQPGHQAYIIAAADTLAREPSRELMARYFPDTPLRDGLETHGSLLSSRKAGEALGYKPQHSWRNLQSA